MSDTESLLHDTSYTDPRTYADAFCKLYVSNIINAALYIACLFVALVYDVSDMSRYIDVMYVSAFSAQVCAALLYRVIYMYRIQQHYLGCEVGGYIHTRWLYTILLNVVFICPNVLFLIDVLRGYGQLHENALDIVRVILNAFFENSLFEKRVAYVLLVLSVLTLGLLPAMYIAALVIACAVSVIVLCVPTVLLVTFAQIAVLQLVMYTDIACAVCD